MKKRLPFPVRPFLAPALAASLAASLGACTLAPGLTSPLGFGSKRDYVSSAPTIPVESAPLQVLPVARNPQNLAGRASSIAVLELPFQIGQVKNVREKHFVNGTRQEIVLDAGPGVYGENVIDVSVRTSGASNADSARILEIGPPSESSIRNEILGRFPDVPMNIVTRPMSNRFGPFGLAIGRHSNGARCIFVWQWIDDLRDHTPGYSNLAKFNAMIGKGALATSVRMRLCRKGMTVDQIAGFVEGLKVPSRQPVERLTRLNRRELANPAVARNSVSESGIRRSPLIRPVGSSLESALANKTSGAAAPKAVAKPKPARKPERSRRAAHISPASAASYNRIRHYNNRGVPVAGTPARQQPVSPAGGRFLAPVANPPPFAGATPVTNYKPSHGVGLPPEAYKGPNG